MRIPARDPQLANLLNEEILGENSRSRPEAVVTYCEWEGARIIAKIYRSKSTASGRERGLSPKFTDQISGCSSNRIRLLQQG